MTTGGSMPPMRLALSLVLATLSRVGPPAGRGPAPRARGSAWCCPAAPRRPSRLARGRRGPSSCPTASRRRRSSTAARSSATSPPWSSSPRTAATGARWAAARCGAGSPASRRATAPWPGRPISSARPGSRTCGVQPIAQDARASLWLPLDVGGHAAGRSGVRRGHHRSRPGVGAAGRSVGDCRRHADGAARLRGRGQPGGAEAHRREGQDRRAARRAAGTHAVRARGRRCAIRGAGQARRGRRLQPDPAARQRAVARLHRLRQSVLQHRRPRRLVPRKRCSIAPPAPACRTRSASRIEFADRDASAA